MSTHLRSLMASSGETSAFHWQFNEVNTKDFNLHNRGVFLVLLLISLVALITTFFLYAHWLCRFRRLSSIATNTAAAASAAPQAEVPGGLDVAIINSLPIILVATNVADSVVLETECSICLSLFEDNEKVKILPECNHAYHSKCVDKWLSRQSSCPLCRASLRVINSANLHSIITP